jgi:hypothetical protein
MLASFPASRDRVKGAYLATADEDTKPCGIRAKVCTRVSGVGRSGLWSGEVVHDDCHAAVRIGVCERLRVHGCRRNWSRRVGIWLAHSAGCWTNAMWHEAPIGSPRIECVRRTCSRFWMSPKRPPPSQGGLERPVGDLADGCGASAPLEIAHLADSDAGLRAKITRVRSRNGGRDLPRVTDYVERVLTGLQLAAEGGVKLVTLLRGSGRSSVVGLGDVLRVVTIGAWLDATGGWVVRAPALASGHDRSLELFQNGERTASEQSSSELLAASDVAEPSVDDEWFRAAVEHIGMRWNGVRVMGEGAQLDLDADWSDAVDADGLARR